MPFPRLPRVRLILRGSSPPHMSRETLEFHHGQANHPSPLRVTTQTNLMKGPKFRSPAARDVGQESSLRQIPPVNNAGPSTTTTFHFLEWY